jgi:hypothetical protein
MLKRVIIILTYFVSVTNLFAQTDYSKFIKADKINKKQTHKYGKDVDSIVYLGVIKDNDGTTIYHVISNFRLVQAAIQKHGHSEIVFLDKNLKVKRGYELSMPEDLPFKLEDNVLYFYYIDNQTKTKQVFKTNISRDLPKLICIAPNDCY